MLGRFAFRALFAVALLLGLVGPAPPSVLAATTISASPASVRAGDNYVTAAWSIDGFDVNADYQIYVGPPGSSVHSSVVQPYVVTQAAGSTPFTTAATHSFDPPRLPPGTYRFRLIRDGNDLLAESPDFTVLDPIPDLEFSIGVGPSRADLLYPNQEVVFTATVENEEQGIATDVEFRAVLPPGMTFLSAHLEGSIPQGAHCADPTVSVSNSGATLKVWRTRASPAPPAPTSPVTITAVLDCSGNPILSPSGYAVVQAGTEESVVVSCPVGGTSQSVTLTAGRGDKYSAFVRGIVNSNPSQYSNKSFEGQVTSISQNRGSPTRHTVAVGSGNGVVLKLSRTN